MKIEINIHDNPTNEDVLKAIFPNYAIFRITMVDKYGHNWLQSPYDQCNHEIDV